MMAILTGSASAVAAAPNPAPASASAAQNFLIALSLFDRPTTLCTASRGRTRCALPARHSDRPRAGSIMLRSVAYRQGGESNDEQAGSEFADAGLLGSAAPPAR